MTGGRPLRVLVVAGEASGDRALAAIVRAMQRADEGALGVGPFDVVGIGGDALTAAGAKLVGHVRDLSGMGVVEVVARAPAIARALVALSRLVRSNAPDVAILASWSAANARIGAELRRRGVPTVWVSPPEVWAWGMRRGGRARGLAGCADRFIVTLPFEEAIWRAAGASAIYLGHPSLDVALPTRDEARRTLGIGTDARAIAILPGSRPAEVTRLLAPMLEAARLVRRAYSSAPFEARIVVAPSLASEVASRVRSLAREHGTLPIDASPGDGALPVLPAFDVALVASGTAALEAAIAGVPPVVAYALHPATMAIARRLVHTPHIALPNVALVRAGRAPAFPELVQEGAVTADRIAGAALDVMADARVAGRCGEVVEVLRGGLPAGGTFAERAAGVVLGAIRDCQ